MAVNQNRERLGEAAQFIKQGDYKSAQAIFRELIKASPRDAELWFLYSFAATERDHQIKSLEKTLALAPNHEKAKQRLAQLRGEAPIPPRAAPKPATPSYALLAGGGLVSLVVIALLIGFMLNRSQQGAEVLSTATVPSATFNIVTRKPIDETEVAPTETPADAAVANQPTFVPTSTREPTDTPVPTATIVTPTERPTYGPVPEIISTVSEVDEIPLSALNEFGGGTGHLLYSLENERPRFNTLDLRDGSITPLALPREIEWAAWASDGRQLMVRQDSTSSASRCRPVSFEKPTAEPCLGFMDSASSSISLLAGLPGIVSISLSPDRTMITYVHQGQVWVAKLDGTEARQITQQSGDYEFGVAEWSPDGRLIAYTYKNNSSGSEPDIYLIAPDGSNDRLFIRDAYAPKWSPDSASLLYIAEIRLGQGKYERHIFVANADGTQARQLTPSGKYDNPLRAVWSPDGRLIAFAAQTGFYVMTADGTQVTHVLEFDRSSTGQTNLSWQPLPASAAVTATPTSTLTLTPIPTLTPTPLSESEVGGGTGQILFPLDTVFNGLTFSMVDLRDGTTSLLTLPDADKIEVAQWVSDGTQLMILKEQRHCGTRTSVDDPTAIESCVGFVTVSSGAVTVIPNFAWVPYVALSPDKRQIAYMSKDSESNWALWVANIDGTNAHQVTGWGSSTMDAVWSPDSRMIAYSMQGQLSVIASDGTGRKALTQGAMPSWSPDGSSLIYVTESEDDGIWMIDVSGENERQIFAKGADERGQIRWPIWSPDGTLIAFVLGRDLYVMKADGSGARLLSKITDEEASKPSWQPMPAKAAHTPTPTPTATLTVTPVSIDEVGGGTGAILFRQGENTYKVLNLRDGSLSTLALPPALSGVRWSSDGRSLLAKQNLAVKSCADATPTTGSTVSCAVLVDPRAPAVSVLPLPADIGAFDLSADGSRIAFLKYDYTEKLQLWVAQVDGSDVRQVTYLPAGVNRDVRWSPDGSFIAYTGWGGDLHIIAPDGTGDRLLALNGFEPEWSPDGRVLAYSDSDYIYTVHADGTNRRQLTYSEGRTSGDGSPVWSPDGRLIAFIRDNPSGPTVHVMQADGTGLRVVSEGSSLMDPSWQPQPAAGPVATYTPMPTLTQKPPLIIPTAIPASGSTVGGGTGRILYSTVVGSTYSFHLVDLKDLSINDEPFPQDIIEAEWLADGRRYLVGKSLASVSCTPGNSQYEPCLGFVNADTNVAHMLGKLPSMRSPVVSPDMNQIAYLDGQLYVMDVDGTNIRQLTHYGENGLDGGILRDPVWSADSRFIAYTVDPSNGVLLPRIDRVSREGSDEAAFIPDAVMPAWSPDGRSLLYISVADLRKDTLMIANADGTNPRPLPMGDNFYASFQGPVWSPDSRLIAFVNRSGIETLYMVPVEGGVPTLLASGGPIGNPSWQPLPSDVDTTEPLGTATITPTVTPTLSPLVYESNEIPTLNASGHIVVKMNSSPNEWIGGGQGTFTVEADGTLVSTGWNISIEAPMDVGSWNFSFFAPNLEVGTTVEGADKLVFTDGGPAMDIRSPGKACNSILGEFTVVQAVPDLVINFTQYCDEDLGQALSGTLIFQPD